MQPLADIRNLKVRFPDEGKDRMVINDISFQLHSGQITAMVGESGSGKSLTALALTGLLPFGASVSGDLLLQESKDQYKNLSQQTGSDWRNIRGNRISMVFQEPMTSLNPLMTCGKQVMESLQLHQQLSKDQAQQICLDWFRKVELPDPASMLHRYPHQLSGGQKQRVMIAMAMCNNPDLLIADEPTTALDVRVQKNIMELIRSLQAESGMAVLLITHDLGLVADMADDILVMHQGILVEQGPAMQILRNPSHPYTKALIACRPGNHSKGKPLPVVQDFLDRGLSNQQVKETSTLLNKKILSDEPVLTVDNLRVDLPVKQTGWSFKKDYKRIVDDVSFSILPGEIMGLAGESGCGKTTLGKAILQLQKTSGGNVVLMGQNLGQLKASQLRKARKEIQVVFQDPYGSLNPRISIGDAIMEPMRIHQTSRNHREARDKTAALLESVQLSADQMNRYPHQFSGGQRQRICIARALAVEPGFMIFDESVSALDVSVQAQILNLINELKAKLNLTALFISHDLSVVRYISDKLMVMKDGKIIESGPADEVFKNPKESYTQELLDAIPGKSLF